MKKNRTKQLAAFLCSAVLAAGTLPVVTGSNVSAADAVSFSHCEGWFETAAAEWEPVSGADGYNVYADGKQIDSMLIRQYNGYYRADIPGLKSGSHTIKVVPLLGGKEAADKATEQTITVKAFDRSGFAFVQGSASGAYNNDGTLKNGTVVLYVTNDTKDSISLEVVTSSNGTKTQCTGIQNILSAYQKGYDSRPLNIRCIGNITDPSVLSGGDLLIKGSSADKRLSCGITIEGIGTDTVFNGFGLRIANCSNVEVRNIGFMNCNSTEGDDIGLQQNNDHIWVHNCDLFYGDAGSDADQAKGDGALDTKTSTYITHSYNHFWDCGKSNLQGMKSETTDNRITYHHNWYDHSDSRHPRIRTCTVHIYNNYFDGNSKYGVGVTMGASAYVEQNYFRNCPKPMMSSKQGTDALGDGTFSGEAGGVIKAYNNIMTDAQSYIPYQKNQSSFDAYEVTNAKDSVPASVKTLSGSTGYNNFDTASDMYSYTADAPADVPNIVTANAGRIQGGDFKWKFDNATDDASASVNTALKAALLNYQSGIVSIGSGAYIGSTEPIVTTTASSATQPTTTNTKPTTAKSTSTTKVTSGTAPQVQPSMYTHNFTENGKESSFFQISGNLSTSKGTVNYGGKTLTQCLKMETATAISFSAPADGKLMLVFGEAAANIKLNGTKYAAENGVITLPVKAGTHTLTKADSCNLFYMEYAPDNAPQQTTTTVTTTTTASAATPTSTTKTTTVSTSTTSETKPAAALAGDVNCSGIVDVSDAVLLARFVAEQEVQITAIGKQNADCDQTAGINSDDVIQILRIIAKLI